MPILQGMVVYHAFGRVNTVSRPCPKLYWTIFILDHSFLWLDFITLSSTSNWMPPSMELMRHWRLIRYVWLFDSSFGWPIFLDLACHNECIELAGTSVTWFFCPFSWCGANDPGFGYLLQCSNIQYGNNWQCHQHCGHRDSIWLCGGNM